MRTARSAVLVALVLAAGGGGAFARGGGKPPEPDPAEIQFVTAYSSADAGARAKAIEQLKAVPDALKLSLISGKVIGTEKRADVVSAAVEVLSKIREETVVEQMVALAKAGEYDTRVCYVEAMATMQGSTSAHAALLELVRDEEIWVRGVAAYSLGEHRAMDALVPLMHLLSDKAWQVQAAALAALPRLSDKDVLRKQVVPELVEFMENASGRLRVDASESLRRITGRNLGKDPGPWRAWLDAGMIDPPKPSGEEGEDKPEAPKSVYGNQDKPHFYGIEVSSNRVVIILDVSLSMYDPIEIDKDRLRRETSRRREITGAKRADPKAPEEDQGYDIPWWKVKTRLDLAKYQTINLVDQLRADQQFEIILYSKDVKPWMSKLVPASPINKQKAIQMLEVIKPEDATNTWGAIAAAFDMVDVNKKGESLGPDEVYLVTDGAPSCGDIVDPKQILEAVLQLCRVKPVKINVIGIGVDLEFMRKMAKSTGGVGKFFKGKEE